MMTAMRVALPRPRGRLRAVGVDVGAALHAVGALLAPLALTFLFPAAIALGYGEPVWPFLLAGTATFACGIGLRRLTAGRRAVGPREGYLVVGIVWILVAAFGALPYLVAVPQLANPVDAFFESMSGFSTTGASVLRDVGELSHSMAMWRQFTAWLGGLGIIVLFLAVLPRLNVAGRQALFRTEMPGPELGLEATIRETARRFVTLYIAITAVEILVLSALGWTGVDERMSFEDAVAHSFATVATAGFSTDPRSLEPFAAATQWAVAVFMVVAGTNFTLMYAALIRRRTRLLTRDEEFRVYVVLLALASALVLVELLSSGLLHGEEAVR